MGAGGRFLILAPFYRTVLATCRVFNTNRQNMTSTKVILVRSSIFLNLVLLVYLCLSWYSTTPLQKLRERQASAEFTDSNSNDLFKRHPLGQNSFVPPLLEVPKVINGVSMEVQKERGENQEDTSSEFAENSDDIASKIPVVPLPAPAKFNSNELNLENKDTTLILKDEDTKDVRKDDANETKDDPKDETKDASKDTGYPDTEYREPLLDTPESLGSLGTAPPPVNPSDPTKETLEQKIYPDFANCPTKSLVQRTIQNGKYWILENHIPASRSFPCDKSITYTTHGDYTFLDNLVPLTTRWQGPVSIAAYAPGSDFEATVTTILYLRECTLPRGVKEFVSFHIYFHRDHRPKTRIPRTSEILNRTVNCTEGAPNWTNVTTYRMQKQLLYPVNVARNIARENSVTYFNFPSDVELYPSINIIPEFFKMLQKPDVSNSKTERVFVFPIFEVSQDQRAPETKAELVRMLKTKKAIPFHKYVCPKCHAQPKSTEWQNATINPGLSVFWVSKRKVPYNKWEPIYIGTNREPIYDERLTWEGRSDKMTQMYILCVNDYEFHILDNAFLVHRPGIKKYRKDKSRDRISSRQTSVIKRTILPDYKILFGSRDGCIM